MKQGDNSKSSKNQINEDWDLVITSKSSWYDVDLKGVWQYRDLILLFVKRDIISHYKQTILGPLWMIIQPLLTTLMFSLIFGKVANIPTGGAPHLLFYLAAYIPWNYFTECLNKNASTFTSNAGIFGKVYFPRLVRPVSVTISSSYKFFVQFLMFVVIYIIFLCKGYEISPNKMILFLPLLMVYPAVLGFSFGLIISSLTTKYRDLNFVTPVFIQLLMYGSSVVFSISHLSVQYKSILVWNPMVWVIEAFRYALIGVGNWSWIGLGYSSLWMIAVLLISVLIFSRVEKNFMDTV